MFSVQKERKVLNDFTVMFEGKYFQLEEIQPTTVFKRDTVIIEEHLNGEIKINFKNNYLNYLILPERPEKVIDVKLSALTKKKQVGWKPPVNHPWRNNFLKNHQIINS